MSDSNLTVGDVLPSSEKDNCSASVLNVSLQEALNVAKYDMPPSDDLSDKQVAELKQIYADYLSKGGDGSGSDSAYWNKSADSNEAYWNKS